MGNSLFSWNNYIRNSRIGRMNIIAYSEIIFTVIVQCFLSLYFKIHFEKENDLYCQDSDYIIGKTMENNGEYNLNKSYTRSY